MATSTGATPAGAPAPAPQQAALSSLQTLQPILAGFNHRNKNQHRSARWWSSFGQLRRHVDKLAGELEMDVASAAAKRQASSKKRKRHLAGDAESSVDDSAAEGRARWLRDVLVPKCYVAFSQAVADNQFATLGVVLLAALAQVDSVCAQLPGGERTGSSFPAADPRRAPTKEVPQEAPPMSANAVDLGQVVSREEVAQLSGQRDDGQADEGQARRKRKAENDAGPLGNVKVDEGSTRNKDKIPKKKRRKAKKGDEFDDLFKGLL